MNKWIYALVVQHMLITPCLSQYCSVIPYLLREWNTFSFLNSSLFLCLHCIVLHLNARLTRIAKILQWNLQERSVSDQSSGLLLLLSLLLLKIVYLTWNFSFLWVWFIFVGDKTRTFLYHDILALLSRQN